MTCEQMRVALSARLDGEDPGAPGEMLDAHLATCPACASWLVQAQRLTRAVRVQAVDVPDMTAAVLAAVAADARAAPRLGAHAHARRQILRLAVAVAAAVQLALAVPVLLWAPAIAGPHSGREMASFDVALAVGFALVAWRPQRARALMPVAMVLAVCLGLTTVIDLAGGNTGLANEAGHLAAAAQAVLLWALGRASGPGPQRRASRAVSA